ncbi:MAG: DUF4366 domain-containing protein [Bacillus sp. (in: Bacteria)]|nr:DUF4366 domain-containing protein [Bacillus sp. (in: firmicutes)]MCM1427857.1 DUF4366 domain-containing protein [Eubacterium sp.]
MKNKKLGVLGITAMICLLLLSGKVVYASDGEDYITISVAATDDNSNLKYALDTDDPSAFTDSNEFTIPAGTSHTIYVKDVAGNITSQKYYPDNDAEDAQDEDGQKINIDLELGAGGDKEIDYSGYEYLTDDPVYPGTGSVTEKVKTDGSDEGSKVFYTIKTKEEEPLYLVIDQQRDEDNVYLLDIVSVSDLLALANGSGKAASTEKEEDNLLEALSKEDTASDEEPVKQQKSSGTSPVIIFIIIAIVGGVYYYFKIYKNKKDEQMDMIDDAMDMDEFEAESTDEDDELEFSFDEAEKEKFLRELIDDDEEEYYNVDPEEYATSHMEANETDAPETRDLDYGELLEDFESEEF